MCMYPKRLEHSLVSLNTCQRVCLILKTLNYKNQWSNGCYGLTQIGKIGWENSPRKVVTKTGWLKVTSQNGITLSRVQKLFSIALSVPFKSVQYVQYNLGTFALRTRLTRKSVCKSLRGTILNAVGAVCVRVKHDTSILRPIHFCHHWSRNLKRGIGSPFDRVNAMGRRPYWPSCIEASYCTFHFGAIIRRNLRISLLPCGSPRDNLNVCMI